MSRRNRQRQPPPDPATQILHEDNEELRNRITELERRLEMAYKISLSHALSDVRIYLERASRKRMGSPNGEEA